MNASEKLTQLIDGGRLTDEQLDNLNNWGIQQVSYLRHYLIVTLNELQNETNGVRYGEVVSALYALLNCDNGEYVVYDYDGVQKLDFDTLNDVLD